MEYIITAGEINGYRSELIRQERSEGTVGQYIAALRKLAEFLGGRAVTKEALGEWKQAVAERYCPRSVNAMIAAVNGFLSYWGRPEWKLRSLRFQRQLFREEELTEEEYRALVQQARREGDEQMVMLLRTMACTGVRVSELKFLTVESARRGTAVIRLKGKTRQIPLGEGLCRELLAYVRREGVSSGPIFRSRRGRPIDRRRVWERLKGLCAGAGVEEKKVHPHALRHFFARMFYRLTRDLVKLADLLGHSSVDTTRIYTASSCSEHRRLLDEMAEAIHKKSPPDRKDACQSGQNPYFVRFEKL